MRTWNTLLTVPAVMVVVVGGAVGAGGAEPVYPGRQWVVRQPGEVGLAADKLKDFSDYVGGFGCVVRHGYLVYTWGDASRRMDVASAAKPVYAHFLFKAVEDGRIAGFDEPVCRWEPRLKDINAKLDHKDAGITWRHVANQVSCYGLAERPGTAFAYNDWQMALLWDTLFTKVYGATYATVDARVLHPQLTDALGCEDNPTFMAFGVENRPGRLAISPRDFARFGLLYLRAGRWQDRQLLRPEHARMAVTEPVPNALPRAGDEPAEMIPGQRTIGSQRIPDNQTDHMGSYSWLWWINGMDRRGKRHWPEAPLDAYGCFGHGGIRAMVVLPRLDLIVSWNDTCVDSREKENEALRRLCASVEVTSAAGPRAAGPRKPPPRRSRPPFWCGPGDPEDFLYRGTLNPDGTRTGDQRQLIDKLKGTGANCIYLMAVRSHGGDGDRTQNPFLDHDPARGINPKVLDQWEQWFTEMDRRGIVIYFFFYDDSARLWDTGDEVGAREEEFLRTLVQRFGHHEHLVWCVAEEYAEALTAERVRRIAALVRAADERRHPLAVHKNHGLDFSEFADDPNIDQFAVQYNVKTAAELHKGVVQAVRDARGRYNINLAEAADWGTGAESRRKCWACAMGGASVMVLGMDIAGTPVADLRDCGRVVRFFTMVAQLEGLEPHDELACGGTQYVLAEPGERYVAYAPEGHGRLGLRHLNAGTYRFTWFDGATGVLIRRERVAVAAGDRTWEKPAELGDELAVFIEHLAD